MSDFLVSIRRRFDTRIRIPILPNFLSFDYAVARERCAPIRRQGLYRFVSSCTISRRPKPRCLDLHSFGLSDREPGFRALKLALHNNFAVSKARPLSHGTRSLILYAFIYSDCVHHVHPGLLVPFVHGVLLLVLAFRCAFRTLLRVQLKSEDY